MIYTLLNKNSNLQHLFFSNDLCMFMTNWADISSICSNNTLSHICRKHWVLGHRCRNCRQSKFSSMFTETGKLTDWGRLGSKLGNQPKHRQSNLTGEKGKIHNPNQAKSKKHQRWLKPKHKGNSRKRVTRQTAGVRGVNMAFLLKER